MKGVERGEEGYVWYELLGQGELKGGREHTMSDEERGKDWRE